MRKGLLLTFFLLISFFGFGQTIHGKITDEQNNSLPAVNISIVNKSIGATSENDGTYS